MDPDHNLLGEAWPIRVRLDRWRPRIPPDAWPPIPPETDALWRRQVFAVADQWHARLCSARSLLVAVLMWGYGVRGYGPVRTVAVLNSDPDGTKLEHNLAPVRTDRPSEDDLCTAYDRFTSASPTHLHRLGPAFFTKMLYFAGYRRGIGGVQPLILDRVVAKRLPEQAGPAGLRHWGWSSRHWLTYLRWAAEQAFRPTFGNEPDGVELALFNGNW